jgi:hypothetical protein
MGCLNKQAIDLKRKMRIVKLAINLKDAQENSPLHVDAIQKK